MLSLTHGPAKIAWRGGGDPRNFLRSYLWRRGRGATLVSRLTQNLSECDVSSPPFSLL